MCLSSHNLTTTIELIYLVRCCYSNPVTTYRYPYSGDRWVHLSVLSCRAKSVPIRSGVRVGDGCKQPLILAYFRRGSDRCLLLLAFFCVGSARDG